MSTSAISAVVPRRRVVVTGDVLSVVSYERPWVRTDVLVLRFLGRAGVPGFAPGRCVAANGTPARDRGALVMLNPLYTFVAVG
jgi:hypothetical protein